MRITRPGAALLLAALLAAPCGAGAQGFALGSGDEPVEVESDRLEVFDKDSTAVFTGNVVLIQGDLLLRTQKLTVYYVQDKKAAQPAQGADSASAGSTMSGTEVERMLAEGKVYLDQGGQIITGDRGEFDVAAGQMVVTGNEVVLTDGGTVVVGCRFTSNSKSGQSKVDSCPNSTSAGRVKMLLQPGSSTPPG